MDKWVVSLVITFTTPQKATRRGGIEPGCAFENLPEDWVLPHLRCVGKDEFEKVVLKNNDLRLRCRTAFMQTASQGRYRQGRLYERHTPAAEKRQGVQFESIHRLRDGSVVSKTLLKKDFGNITLFAFDAGQGLSGTRQPFDAVV